MEHDRERIQRMIHDTVSLLCRNSLSHGVGVRIQGLIGITVDDSEVILVQFDDSYGNNVGGSSEYSRRQHVDRTGATCSPSKRPRISKIPSAASSYNPAAEETAAAEADCDVIFITDEVNDTDTKLEFDQFSSSVDDGHNYDPTDGTPVFTSEDNFTTGNLYTDIGSRENRSGYIQHGSERNAMLQNMLTDQNNYASDQAPVWQSESASYEQTTTVQTTSIKCEQTTVRPRAKQVLVKFFSWELWGTAKHTQHEHHLCVCAAQEWSQIVFALQTLQCCFLYGYLLRPTDTRKQVAK